MDDLISRQAAIEALGEPFVMSQCMTMEECDHMNFARALCIARIESIEAAQRWIPVTERMPDAYYLVWATDGKDVGIASFQRKGNFWLGDDNFSDYQPEVTHWMPLPEPPKKEDEA